MNARLRAGLVLLLVTASVGLGAALKPTVRLADSRPRVDLETLFPKAFGTWRLDERRSIQLIAPDVQQLLDRLYNQTLSRAYVNEHGYRIMLSVAYGGDQSDATRAHRPEVCYPVQGFQIVSSQTSSVALPGHSALPVNHLVARQGARNEPITYWITVGEKVALSGFDQKLAQLSYSLRGVVSDGMLVRISSIDKDAQSAFAEHAKFVQQLSTAMPAASASLALGRAAVAP